HRGGDQQRDQVHDLQQGVDRRARGVLERIADGVTDDGRVVGLGALSAVESVFDELLSVIPSAAGVRQEHRHQYAGADGAGQVGTQRPDTHAKADRDGREDRQNSRCGELTQGIAGADVDDATVFGPAAAVHDAGDVPELTTYLEDDRAGGAADRVNRQTGEQEDHGRTDHQSDQIAGIGHIQNALEGIRLKYGQSTGFVDVDIGGLDRVFNRIGERPE